MIDKRDLADVFRERVRKLIARQGGSLSAFARVAGIDRSALTQFLAEGGTRLPRAETLTRIASGYSVSLDWLLGLSQDDALMTEMMSQMEIEHVSRSHDDAKVDVWRKEAIGAKIRYVPSTLPDLIRTDATTHYEFGQADTELLDAKSDQSERQLSYSRRPETDTEICMPKQTLVDFSQGVGIWNGLEREVRIEQLHHMSEILDELYPTLRVFLFDARQVFSAPYTVFGVLRAAIYLGESYLVVNSVEHIRMLIGHFDSLIRASEVTPDRASLWVKELAAQTDT